MSLERNIKLMYGYGFFNRFVFAFPIKILFFAEVLGSYTLAMSVFALQEISCALLEIPTGFLSDKIGRKWVCVAGAVSRVASMVLYAISGNYLILALGSIFYGLSEALSSGNNNALIYDSLAEKGQKSIYQRVCSRFYASEQLGLSLGALCCFAFALISLRTVMIASCFPVTIALLLTFFLKEPPRSCSESPQFVSHIWASAKLLWHNRRLRLLSLGSSLQYGFNEAAFDFNATFIKQFVPVWSLGFFRAAGHFFNGMGMYFSEKVTKFLGIRRTVVYSFFCDNIGNLIAVLAASVWTPFIRLLAPLFAGPGVPALEKVLQDEYPNDKRATIPSLISLLERFFYSLCALFIGFWADLINPYAALVIAYTLGLASNYLFVVGLKEHSSNVKEI